MGKETASLIGIIIMVIPRWVFSLLEVIFVHLFRLFALFMSSATSVAIMTIIIFISFVSTWLGRAFSELTRFLVDTAA